MIKTHFDLVAVRCAGGGVEHALVSPEDYPGLSVQYWQKGSDGYARRHATKREKNDGCPSGIAMHRQVVGLHTTRGAYGKDEVDHINRNRLDNRRENLRIVQRGINIMNRAGSGKYSKYIGVSFFKPASLWRAYIQHEGKRLEIGYFKTEYLAVLARDEKAKELFGALATLNIT